MQKNDTLTKESRSLTDEEMLARFREGDMTMQELLMSRYKDLVRIKARSMYIIGGDNDDLIQEGMIGLLKAVRDYDFGRDASFHTFAELCVSRQMYTAVQASGRKKHLPLSNYISLYKSASDETGGENGQDLLSVLEGPGELEPEKALIERENLERIFDVIDRELSPFEKQVLELRLTGMGSGDIAAVLGRAPKSTDNALTRIKSKLKDKLL